MSKTKDMAIDMAEKERKERAKRDAQMYEMLRDYHQACNAFKDELLRQWEMDDYYGSWVGDEVGGTYAYEDGETFITMDDIIYCVEHNVPHSDYTDWTDYCVRVSNAFGPQEATPNFPSWHKGCPRYSDEQLRRIEEARQGLAELIEEERKKPDQTF